GADRFSCLSSLWLTHNQFKRCSVSGRAI
ncbi:hypothetical protein D021_3042B, partial [Vibrio parahaemolyticus 10296]